MEYGETPSHWKVEVLPKYWEEQDKTVFNVLIKLSHKDSSQTFQLFREYIPTHLIDSQWAGRFIGFTYRKKYLDLMEIIILGDQQTKENQLTFREVVTFKKIG